jgi:PII-like signaling protein/CBS-domain-containing membrane protein
MRTETGRRVRVYLSEADRSEGRPLDRALIDLLRRSGARGAIAFRGVEGFGASRRLHADLLVDVAPELPVVVEWIDGPDTVRRLLPAVAALAAGATITVDALQASAREPLAGSAASEGGAERGGTDMEGTEQARRVRIYLGQDDRAAGRPAHLAVVEHLRARNARGATVLGGIEGFGAEGEIHGTHLAELGRRLPIVVEWVDRADVVAGLLDEIRALVPAALVTVEDTAVVQHPPAQVRDVPRGLRARDVMTRDVVSVERGTPLRALVERMLGEGYRAVPVLEDGKPVGIVTSTDLIRRGGFAAGLDLVARLGERERRASVEHLAGGGKVAADVMTPDPVLVTETEGLRRIAGIMVQRRLKRLPVVGADGRLAGMVGRLDLLRAAAGEAEGAAPPPVAPGLDATGPVSRVLRSDAPLVHPDTPLPAVIQAVVSTRLHRALVVDASGHVVGLVTDAELLDRLTPELRTGALRALVHRLPFVHPSPAGAAAEQHAQARTAGDLMVREVPAVPEETPVAMAIQRMLRGNHKVLAVTDAAGRLAGIVDRADLLRGLLLGG